MRPLQQDKEQQVPNYIYTRFQDHPFDEWVDQI